MTHDNSPRPLTAHEFEVMMRELDDAQDWMLNQLMQRQLVQAASHASAESDQMQ